MERKTKTIKATMKNYNYSEMAIIIRCPHCKDITKAEPDATSHNCFVCDGHIKIDNHIYWSTIYRILSLSQYRAE
jgi:hypothetical protein